MDSDLSTRDHTVPVATADSDDRRLLMNTSASEATQRLNGLIARLQACLKPEWGVAHYPTDEREPRALLRRASVLEAPDHSLHSVLLLEHAGMDELHHLIERVAGSSINVLLSGETGVGKEVYAQRIHHLSKRASKPFLCLNC